MRSLLDGAPDHEIKSIFSSQGMLFKYISIFSSGLAILFSRVEPFVQFWYRAFHF